MILAPLFPYIAAGCVLAGLGGGWWIMDARLDRCKTARANLDAQIVALRAANADLHKAVTDQSAATIRLAEDGKARQQKAEAALEAILRAQTATRTTIASLGARIQAPGASALDCAVATAEVRASIR
jgi:hypothetical protein